MSIDPLPSAIRVYLGSLRVNGLKQFVISGVSDDWLIFTFISSEIFEYYHKLPNLLDFKVILCHVISQISRSLVMSFFLRGHLETWSTCYRGCLTGAKFRLRRRGLCI